MTFQSLTYTWFENTLHGRFSRDSKLLINQFLSQGTGSLDPNTIEFAIFGKTVSYLCILQVPTNFQYKCYYLNQINPFIYVSDSRLTL